MTLFPFCIITPWMPDGNITQYTQTELGADRLMLVRHGVHECHIDPAINEDNSLTSSPIAHPSVSRPHVPP